MTVRSLIRTSAVIAVGMLTAWIISAQQAKKVDNNALRGAAKNGEEWLTHGHDYAETHFSPLKQIDSKNVKRLGLAWTWETQAPNGSNVEAPMLVSNGVMYGSLGWNVMFAIDARTGQLKWRWDPELPRSVMTASAVLPPIAELRCTTAGFIRECSMARWSPSIRKPANRCGARR